MTVIRRLSVFVCLCALALPVRAAVPGILVFGDSLSAAYGLPLEQGWVALMQNRLREQGYVHDVINKSISGETTTGGLARLPQALTEAKPALVLIELGANDGLRAQSLKQMRNNLSQMIQLSRAAGAQVLLFEMRLPSNYGRRYTEKFHASFAQVAEAEKVALLPFFMREIALDAKYFLDDGIHPSAEAQPLLLDVIWPYVAELLQAENTK